MDDAAVKRAARRVLQDRAAAFPLMALQGIRDLRGHALEIEIRCMERAIELGATKEDVAEALGITRQGVDYKLRSARGSFESLLPEAQAVES